MNISWHGEGMIKITGKTADSVVLLFDPYSEKETGLRPVRPAVDVVLTSSGEVDRSKLKGTEGDPFVIDGPGEFDVKGVTIRGIPTFRDGKQGEEHGTNTIFGIDLENVKVCHLGALGHELTSKQISEIGNCDILMIPVGGNGALDTKKAASVISEVEPRIVIPIFYKVPKLKTKRDSLDAFVKEMGASNVKPESKLKIKRSDLPREETRVVLLERE